MDFSNVKSITIPEGKVKRILSGSTVLWQAQTGRIPSEFQEVDYIKAADNVGCYINLGFAFDTSARIYLSQYIETPKSGQYGYVFGAAENSGKLRCMISSPYLDNGGATGYGSTGTSYIGSAVAVKNNSLNEFELILKKGELRIKNITTGVSSPPPTGQATYTMTSNLYLLAQNYNGSARFGYGRIVKAFSYYDKTDTLICDLVPCYRKSDGVIGMYDIVRKIFLTNVGTGSFTKGADV